MRIYQNFKEAFEEVKRDLAEMGTDVWPQTVHDKDITGTEEYATKELMNYAYCVEKPKLSDIPVPNFGWLTAEWKDRKAGITGHPSMIGSSMFARKEATGDVITWTDMMEVGGKPIKFGEDPFALSEEQHVDTAFSYTYAERLAVNRQVWQIIERLKKDKASRQLYISIWRPDIDSGRLGQRRIPCSLGYHFLYRKAKLHVTYTMRSCELGTHYYNDCWFAYALCQLIAEKCDVETGSFTHFINSLHCYTKNLTGVF